MKYLIIIIITIAALCYFGVLSFNKGTASKYVKRGANKSIELTKKGVNVLGKELQKATK